MALAWHDGKFVDKSSIKISPSDFGFSRGVAVFEFTRVYGGVPFHLDDHIERFRLGAEMFGIELPLTPAQIVDAVRHMIAENKFPQSTLRFYVTAGECGFPGAGGFATCDAFTPHLMLMEDDAHPVHPEAPKGGLELYRRGISLKTVPFARQLSPVKHINYMPGFLASREWGQQGWDDILYTCADGRITETPVGNFFAVIDGTLCTPAEDMLHGVTRKVLLDIAQRNGIPVAVCNITASELANATEAFATGTFAEMLPVSKIDDHVLPTTTEGPVYKKLRQLFTEYIKEYCRK